MHPYTRVITRDPRVLPSLRHSRVRYTMRDLREWIHVIPAVQHKFHATREIHAGIPWRVDVVPVCASITTDPRHAYNETERYRDTTDGLM